MQNVAQACEEHGSVDVGLALALMPTCRTALCIAVALGVLPRAQAKTKFQECNEYNDAELFTWLVFIQTLLVNTVMAGYSRKEDIALMKEYLAAFVPQLFNQDMPKPSSEPVSFSPPRPEKASPEKATKAKAKAKITVEEEKRQQAAKREQFEEEKKKREERARKAEEERRIQEEHGVLLFVDLHKDCRFPRNGEKAHQFTQCPASLDNYRSLRPCTKCVGIVNVVPRTIKFTRYGECYHVSEHCSGLSRRTTPLTEAYACGKCCMSACSRTTCLR